MALQLIGTTASVSVTVDEQIHNVAPATPIFRVTSLSGFTTPAPSSNHDPRLTNFDFFWTFGDSGATFDVPTRLKTWQQDANVAFGFEAAHTYESAGSYIWTLTVREVSSGKTAQASGTITVNAPNSVFTDIHYVDPDGTYTSSPIAGSGANHTTIAAALTAVKTNGNLAQILLRRGVTHNITAQYNMSGVWPNLYMAAGGPAGADPIVDVSGVSGNPTRALWLSLDETTPTDYQFVNLDIRGGLNPLTDLPATPRAAFINTDNTAGKDPPSFLQFHRCQTRGLEFDTYPLGNPLPYCVFSHHKTHDFNKSQAFGGYLKMVYLGSEIQADPNALNRDTASGWQAGFPVRINNYDAFIMDGCDFFVHDGWTVDNFPIASAQSALRLAVTFPSSYDSNLNYHTNIHRSIFEAGLDMIELGTIHEGNARIEHNYFLANQSTISAVNNARGGLSFRNNVIALPAITKRTVGFQSVFRDTSAAAAVDGEVLIERNTLVRNSTGGAVPFVIGDNWNSSTVRDNITHAPNASTAVTTYAPISTTAYHTPKNDTGISTNFELYSGTLGADVANGETFDVTYSEGDASYFQQPGQAEVKIAGTTRSATYSFGASAVTITNTSGVPWTLGQAYAVALERVNAQGQLLDTGYLTPSTDAWEGKPQSGSSAIGGAAGPDVYRKFDTSVRTSQDVGAW